MKKSLMFAVAAMALSLCAFGAETTAKTTTKAEAAAPAKKEAHWTPFQLVFLPGCPASSSTSNVNGLKLGIPCTGGTGNVRGVEASFLYSGTSFNGKDSLVDGIQASWFGPALGNNVKGIQATMSFAMANELVGFQASGIGFLKGPSYGCQASLGGTAMGDFKGFQTGASNVTCGDFKGFQFGASNVATQKMSGCQCGAVGVAGEASGCQINLFNIVTKVSNAFQCGIFNYSSSKGIQLGAVNIIKDNWLPVMVIVNFSL